MVEPPASPEPSRRVTLARWLALPLLIGWCVILLLGAMPSEITPPPMVPLTSAVQEAFDRVGVRAGSFVFSGGRGDQKRRFFAMRVLGWHPNGSYTILHESPEDLHYDTLRPRVSMRDTLSFKMLEFSTVSQLYSTVNPDARADLIARLRDSRRSARVGRFFCESKHFAAGDPRDAISIEHYEASVSYTTGALTAFRDTVVSYNCKSHELQTSWPEPAGEPDWPGVSWR